MDKLPTAESLDKAITKADKLLKKTSDREQEDIMRTHAMKRLEEKVDQNTKDVQTIKPLVSLAEVA